MNVYITRGIVLGLGMGGQGDGREVACLCLLRALSPVGQTDRFTTNSNMR